MPGIVCIWMSSKSQVLKTWSPAVVLAKATEILGGEAILEKVDYKGCLWLSIEIYYLCFNK